MTVETIKVKYDPLHTILTFLERWLFIDKAKFVKILSLLDKFYLLLDKFQVCRKAIGLNPVFFLLEALNIKFVK